MPQLFAINHREVVIYVIAHSLFKWRERERERDVKSEKNISHFGNAWVGSDIKQSTHLLVEDWEEKDCNCSIHVFQENIFEKLN